MIMTLSIGGVPYVPGTYKLPGRNAEELANRFIQEWDEKRIRTGTEKRTLPPAVCFSRKIGAGALEIADLLADRIGYRVVEREILEHIARDAHLSERTVAFFDERYTGKINEFFAYAFGEKAFIQSDYAKHLFSAVYAIANLNPTIFVGRGTHMILPRDRVLAVRVICSDEMRIDRLSSVLQVGREDVKKSLKAIDKDQAEFYKSVFDKKDASPYEFDLVIHADHIRDPEWAAEIIACAFRLKFGIKESP
jgi:cytidylate kinase